MRHAGHMHNHNSACGRSAIRFIRCMLFQVSNSNTEATTSQNNQTLDEPAVGVAGSATATAPSAAAAAPAAASAAVGPVAPAAVPHLAPPGWSSSITASASSALAVATTPSPGGDRLPQQAAGLAAALRKGRSAGSGHASSGVLPLPSTALAMPTPRLPPLLLAAPAPAAAIASASSWLLPLPLPASPASSSTEEQPPAK